MNMSVGVTIEVFRRGAIVLRGKEEDDEGCGALKKVDRQLAKGDLKSAHSLVKQWIRCCQTDLLSDHYILDSIKNSLQSNESCVTEDSDLYLEDDIVEHKQVVQHEAGHFLVGYLLGVLPKEYTFSSMEDNHFNASVKFVGFEFLTELEDAVPLLLEKNLHQVKPRHRANKHKLSSTVLSKFARVIVGGLVAEHMVYGYAKGHHEDVEKLEMVLKWLQFTEDEANDHIKWAALNTLLILHHHSAAMSKLAEAMQQGRSIGYCIHIIETNLNHK